MNKPKVKIDIISDVVCPWCIIGYKRLEKALESVSNQVIADIYWHPFELNPRMVQGGENLRDHLSKKYGTTLEDSIKAREQLTIKGKELGFTFDYFDEMKMFNTFKAHQLLHHARKYDKDHDLQMRLFSSFFSERKAIDQIDVLVKEAASIGLDEKECYSVLKNKIYADAVRIEENEWFTQGVQVVPTFVINHKYRLSGAQESTILADIILKSIQ